VPSFPKHIASRHAFLRQPKAVVPASFTPETLFSRRPLTLRSYRFYLADAIALKRNPSNEPRNGFGPPLLTDLSQVSLTRIMSATRFKACNLPKDKFFALYSVLQELGFPHKLLTAIYYQSEADIFRVVHESCTTLDENWDVLRLAQSLARYLSYDDFLRSGKDAYDSFFATAVSSISKDIMT